MPFMHVVVDLSNLNRPLLFSRRTPQATADSQSFKEGERSVFRSGSHWHRGAKAK